MTKGHVTSICCLTTSDACNPYQSHVRLQIFLWEKVEKFLLDNPLGLIEYRDWLYYPLPLVTLELQVTWPKQLSGGWFPMVIESWDGGIRGLWWRVVYRKHMASYSGLHGATGWPWVMDIWPCWPVRTGGRGRGERLIALMSCLRSDSVGPNLCLVSSAHQNLSRCGAEMLSCSRQVTTHILTLYIAGLHKIWHFLFGFLCMTSIV